MPWYRVTNTRNRVEEFDEVVEADSEEEALNSLDDEDGWNFSYTEYGNAEVEEVEDQDGESREG